MAALGVKLSVAVRCNSFNAFEFPDKVTCVVKTHHKSNFINGFIHGYQHFFGFGDAVMYEIVVGIEAHIFFKFTNKMTLRYMEF